MSGRAPGQFATNGVPRPAAPIRFARVQREDKGKTKTESDKYADAGKKIGAAFLETDVGAPLAA